MKTFGQLKAEILTAARVKGVNPEAIMEEVVNWIDYNYHGVVRFPFDIAPTVESDPVSRKGKVRSGALNAELPGSKPEGQGLEELPEG